MNYIAILDNDELMCICRIMTGRPLRDLFRKNPQPFNRIKGGYSFKKASEEETFLFVVRNRGEDFIAGFINWWIEKRLNEVKQHMEGLLDGGKQPAEALAETLVQSVFSDQVKLFCKLSEVDSVVDSASIVSYAVGLQREIEAYKEKESAKMDTIAKVENQMEAVQEEYESRLATLQAEYDKLKNTREAETEELSRAEEELSIVKSKLIEYQELEKYRVVEDSFSPALGYTYLSLCRTYTDGLGRARLNRCADITDEGEISTSFSTEAPSKKRLYQNQKEALKENGFYGVWNWTVKPNESDPTKDYFETSYNPKHIPTLVVIINECSSVPAMIEQLKAGIRVPFFPGRILFSFFNGATYEGLLCSTDSLRGQGDKLYLAETVRELALFEFTENDIVRIESTIFLRFLNTGRPNRIVPVKNPLEITKEVVYNRLSWSVLKQKDFTKKEFSRIKALIKEMPVDGLYEQISSECDCSKDEAQQLIEEFIIQADTILAGDTLESNIMAQVIRNDPQLFNECQEELQQEWEADNKDKISAAEAALAKTQKLDSELSREIERKKKESAVLDNQYTSLQEQITERQKFAEAVEAKVLERIDQARKDAADFIAEQAFVSSFIPSSETRVTQAAKNTTYIPGSYRSREDLEINECWEDVLDTIRTELQEAGINSKNSAALSSILYSAYINQIPVLLAGPNGQSIAEAFSVALLGCTPAVLRCMGDYCEEELQKTEEANTGVVVIENIFEHQWYWQVLRVLSKRKRFYFVLQPFSEDLAIEPNGLVNYCLPLFTEMFVEMAPTGNYYGGRMAEVFRPFVQKPVDDQGYKKLLRQINLSPYAMKSVQRILTDIHEMLSETADDADIMLLQPIARLFDAEDELTEYQRKKDLTIS